MKQEFTKELLDQLIAEENKYQFHTFSHEDAKCLGEMLYENSKRYERTVGVEIRINGDTIYKYMPDSCNRENGKWLRAKSNTVDMMAMSTLHLATMLSLNGQTLEDKKMNSVDYGTYGGGFPLIIKGVGTVGSICVSGLEHFKDHELIATTLQEYFENREIS